MTSYNSYPASLVQLAGGTYYGPNLLRLASSGSHEIWYRPGHMGFAGQSQRRKWNPPVYMLVRLKFPRGGSNLHTVLLTVVPGSHWRRCLTELRYLLAETDRC